MVRIVTVLVVVLGLPTTVNAAEVVSDYFFIQRIDVSPTGLLIKASPSSAAAGCRSGAFRIYYRKLDQTLESVSWAVDVISRTQQLVADGAITSAPYRVVYEDAGDSCLVRQLRIEQN